MIRIEHNPPAFPVELAWGLEPGETSQTGEVHAQFPGMTLRDWFAGQALAGLADKYGGSYSIHPNDATRAVKQCYQLADAMLAERQKALAAAALKARGV